MATDDLPADDPHRRPPGVDDRTVEAVGKLSEMLEWVERARGRLYDFHQLMGHADGLLDDACARLREAGHGAVADRLEAEMVGRNVLEGRWTFQIVEEFDDTYWGPLRAVDGWVRRELVDGRRHVYESAMKEARRTRGARHHEARP